MTPTQVAGVPWKNPVATASGTFQYAAVRWFYDVSQLGAVTTKGVSPVPWEGNPGIRTAEGPSSNINAVGLQNPDRPEAYFGTVSIEDACVVTSGAYQRYFEENGVRYHHILDLMTGCPAESGLKSVSIVAEDDTLADALSTALFVMGLDAGAELQKSSGLSFEAVFVTDENTVWITPGLAGRYRSDRPYQILE